VHYQHPPIASLLIGVAQEADPVSPGFKQSTAISNHSTLDFTLHYGEHWIVLPGNASWKRLCSSSMPPDDDNDSPPRRGSAAGRNFLAPPYYTQHAFLCDCFIHSGLYSWSQLGKSYLAPPRELCFHLFLSVCLPTGLLKN